ncbi:hypothetical protein Tco_0735697 [Tanacetum coccineum]
MDLQGASCISCLLLGIYYHVFCMSDVTYTLVYTNSGARDRVYRERCEEVIGRGDSTGHRTRKRGLPLQQVIRDCLVPERDTSGLVALLEDDIVGDSSWMVEEEAYCFPEALGSFDGLSRAIILSFRPIVNCARTRWLENFDSSDGPEARDEQHADELLACRSSSRGELDSARTEG